MKKLLLTLLIACGAHAQQSVIPVPKDPFNTPIYGGLGYPYVFEAVTLATTAYVSLGNLPLSGQNTGRSFRSIIVRNASTTRTVYICFGDTACSTDMLVIPPEFALSADNILYGSTTSDTKVFGRLDAVGSVTPQIMVW